jgi:hypothetical protein
MPESTSETGRIVSYWRTSETSPLLYEEVKIPATTVEQIGNVTLRNALQSKMSYESVLGDNDNPWSMIVVADATGGLRSVWMAHRDAGQFPTPNV